MVNAGDRSVGDDGGGVMDIGSPIDKTNDGNDSGGRPGHLFDGSCGWLL